jgi:hypothetical protein
VNTWKNLISIKSIISLLKNEKTAGILFILILLIITPMVISAYIRVEIDTYDCSRFEEMINGTAHKPFVYRVLVPVIIKSASAAIPQNIKQRINDYGVKNVKYLTEKGKNIYLADLLIAAFVWYLSIIGFALVMKKILTDVYIVDKRVLYTIILFSVMGITIFFRYYSYIYDFTYLFLYSLSLYYLSKSKWALYLAAFILTTINKETSILLVMVYFIHYRNKLPKPLFVKLLTAQLAIFIVIKTTINLIFINNPGSIVEFHILNNIAMHPFSLSDFIAFVVLVVAVVYDWKNKPIFAKQSLSVFIPLVTLTLFLGLLSEFRDYYEVYPPLIILVVYTIGKILGDGIITLNEKNSFCENKKIIKN